MRDPSRPHTGDMVVLRSNPTATPVRVTRVDWTSAGDLLWFMLNGRTYGPKPASDYKVVERRP